MHVEHAARAVEAGDCEVVLITYGSVQLSAMGRRIGGGRGGAVSATQAWDAMWGNTLVGAYALAATRHMAQYGTTAEQLAEIAVTFRRHAGFNPSAQYRDPITVDDVLVVADGRRPAAHARLLRGLRRRRGVHRHDRGAGP